MKSFLILGLLNLAITNVFAQVTNNNSELYKAILLKDSLFFNEGFNACNLSQLEELLSDSSFEFYHDKGGFSNKEGFLKTMREGLCKEDTPYQSIRKLVPGLSGVYPLYKGDTLYGALQEGQHQFYEKLAGKPEEYRGQAKFTSLWLLENKEWKLARVFSFDHNSD